ncbi:MULTISPECIES: hypothetical protein [unclassified Mesorhizobium]|uniref:hypothetical protein n=1 Tax=unclassified Mesorhizobium TaxID=325217 RepID=UPI000FCB5EED|nr:MULTISPECIES: hypothetical protein [unclassified Mesorhizobium]RUV26310.1 hypothetical protein EOA91_05270 [Mesorhizobium sp. M1A.F.Ca.IN.022.04.1.1]RWG36607.1 MAG: hypothetical protein EOQ60_04225 [Mesorhizobium sp.]
MRLFSSGKLKDWSSIKAAAQAVRDRIEQGGMFDDENRPEPSKDDIAAVSRMEKTVERIIAAIAGGFKDGECIALKSVDPSKADKWADTLAAASRVRWSRSCARHMRARCWCRNPHRRLRPAAVVGRGSGLVSAAPFFSSSVEASPARVSRRRSLRTLVGRRARPRPPLVAQRPIWRVPSPAPWRNVRIGRRPNFP